MTQSILLWMDGQHLLSHPSLGLLLSGMRKVLYIVQFLSLSGRFPISICFCFYLPAVIIRLKQKHDGEYLASVTADCLNRFGLAELVRMPVMIIFQY